jgi:hypothetical protein
MDPRAAVPCTVLPATTTLWRGWQRPASDDPGQNKRGEFKTPRPCGMFDDIDVAAERAKWFIDRGAKADDQRSEGGRFRRATRPPATPETLRGVGSLVVRGT